MIQKEKEKQVPSKVDILKEKIDLIFTKHGLRPSIWENKKGFGAYFPKQKKKQKYIKNKNNMDIKDLQKANPSYHQKTKKT